MQPLRGRSGCETVVLAIFKKNQIIKKDNNQKNNLITLISEKTKQLTFKNVFEKRILFVRLYDKHLYLFLSKITNKNTGLFLPKSKENINSIKGHNFSNSQINSKNNMSQMLKRLIDSS